MEKPQVSNNKLPECTFSFVYEQYLDDLYSYGMGFGVSEDDCLDAIQDVFYKLFSSRKKLAEIENLKTYLLCCLRNRLFDIARHSGRMFTLPVDSIVFNTDAGFTDTLVISEEQKIIKEKVEALMNSLSSRQREIIYLRYMQKLDYDEIARIMNITPESARKQVYRSILAMRKHACKKAVFAFLFHFM